MKEVTISIIANFYKSEAYIPKLIKSVIGQTYGDWELICVNDCSPGRDSKILHHLASKYKDQNIKIIDNPSNVGISRAKRIGIDAARGKYLTFIDGDDWLAPEALERMVNAAEKHNADIVIMDNYKILPRLGYKKRHLSNPKDGFNRPIDLPGNTLEEYIINFYGEHIYNCGYWGKLFKSTLVKEMDFTLNDNPAGEDFFFNFSALRHARRICFIDYADYYWRWGGITSGKKSDVFSGSRYFEAVNDTYIYLDSFVKGFSQKDKFRLLHLINHRDAFYHNLISQATEPIDSPQGQVVMAELHRIFANHRSYDDMSLLPKLDPTYADDPVVKAIIAKDAETLYDLAHTDYKNGWKGRLLRRILHSILYFH